MDLSGKDMVIGDFKLSDYGFMLASFDPGSSNFEDELGMDYETIEEFIGQNPVPVYLGARYTGKLKPHAAVVKDPRYNKDMYFSEHECRELLRQLTGFTGYRLMQIYSYKLDELLYYNVRITNASYKKIGGKVAGILLSMECDSQFAWSKEFTAVYTAAAGQPFLFCNTSDDLYHYLLPSVTIASAAPIERLDIQNLSDGGWTTTIQHIRQGEIIQMDSQHEILTSSVPGRMLWNDFNMHFIRLIAGQNQIQTNSNIQMTFRFRLPRKAGFLCE